MENRGLEAKDKHVCNRDAVQMGFSRKGKDVTMMMIKMWCLCVHRRDHREKRYTQEVFPLGLELSLRCTASWCVVNCERKLKNVCLEKAFTLTLSVAGQTLSCGCRSLRPRLCVLGGGEGGTAQLPRCFAVAERK